MEEIIFGEDEKLHRRELVAQFETRPLRVFRILLYSMSVALGQVVLDKGVPQAPREAMLCKLCMDFLKDTEKFFPEKTDDSEVHV